MRIKTVYLIVVLLAGIAIAKRPPKKEKSKPIAEPATADSEPTNFATLNSPLLLSTGRFDSADNVGSVASPSTGLSAGLSALNGPRGLTAKTDEAIDLPSEGVRPAEDGIPPGSPTSDNANENAEAGDPITVTHPDGAEGSDSENADGDVTGARMLDLEDDQYPGYSNIQQSQYSEVGTYGNNPVETYGNSPVGTYGSPVGNYGNTQQIGYGQIGLMGNLGVTPQPAMVGSYGTGQIGNYGNLGQMGGFGMGSIGIQTPTQPQAANVVQQQESFSKVESYGNTPTANQVNFGNVPVSFGSGGNFGNMGANIQGQLGGLQFGAQTPAPTIKKEEFVRIETEKVDDGKPVQLVSNLSSMNFNAGQFGNAASLSQFGMAQPGFGSFGGFGGLGSQFGGFGSGFGGFGSGFGGFGGFGAMGMMNPMMNPMVMSQFEESSGYGGNEEVGVRTSSDNAYPVPMPIPFHMPQPQPFPVPVHTPFGVPIPVPHPYPVEKAVEVRVPVNKPYPVPVNQMIPFPVKEVVTVNKPYPVHVPVEIEKPVKVEVPVPFPVTMYQQVRVPEPRPYPVHIRKNVPMPMPFPVPIQQPENNFHKMMC